MNEGQYLRIQFEEAKEKKAFDAKAFWTNIGASRSTGYALFKQTILKEPYRSNVQKHFKVKFPDLKKKTNPEFVESKKDITIRKQQNKIRDLKNTVTSKEIEIKILEDELILYRSLNENKTAKSKKKKDDK